MPEHKEKRGLIDKDTRYREKRELGDRIQGTKRKDDL